MKDSAPRRELPEAALEHRDIARQLVRDGLGEEYDVDFNANMPRNVGILGDEGVIGDTLMITAETEDPAENFSANYDQLGRVATEICNQTPTTKVLIDISPHGITPTYISDNKEKAEDTVPFADIVRQRIEGYYHLKMKYSDQLDDPYMQTAVWMIMNVIDAKFKADMARRFAE